MATPEPKVDVKTAVSNALAYVKSLYTGQSLRDLLLEEVELSESDSQWRITVGFSLPKDEPPFLISPRQLARHYKVVLIDATTGEALSMRIRDI